MKSVITKLTKINGMDVHRPDICAMGLADNFLTIEITKLFKYVPSFFLDVAYSII